MSEKLSPAGLIATKAKELIHKEIPKEVEKQIAEMPVASDGLGFNVKAWDEGIHREGSVVQHNFGQCFKALRDNNSEPGLSDDWERVGNVGLRWTGLKQADFDYKDGDLYIDGGSCFIVTDGKAKMFVQRGKNGTDGKNGADGADGKDAPSIIEFRLDTKGLMAVMDDGSIVHGEADIESYIEEVASQKALLWLEQQFAEEDKIGVRFRLFRGQYKRGESYSKGDVITFNKSTYIAKEADSNSQFVDLDKWTKFGGAGSGGGGGGASGASAFLGNQWNRAGAMSLGGQGIYNLAAPRPGTVGRTDATNKGYVDAAIAAGALYQGIYTVATNNPNLQLKANVNVTAPVAGSVVNRPNVGAPALGSPGNILTWHNWKGNGFDTFAATTTVPRPLSVMLSDGRIVTHNIPAKAYADEAALKAELETLFAATTEIAAFWVYVNGADCHIGVETTPPVYCTAISNETGNAFPAAVPGPANSILNTYNWVVQTRDENTPEALPIGLPGLPAGTIVKNSDVLQWSSTKNGFEIISGSSLTQSFSDQRYWQINGDNMAWVDQAYNKGSIVYDASKNAWFVASQNIVAGTPEPGTLAAGAMWRKINSTYGATVFFGQGDYDTSDTTAANNWGMPTGTYPSGQQPLNGDSYFDIKTGTTVDFSVADGAIIYTISGSLGSKQLDVAGSSILDNWPGSFVGANQGDYWHVAAVSTPYTFGGGVFAGTTIPANTAFNIVWSGDPDADNNGWIIVQDPATTWTINTPHGQKQPDIITPTIIWGTRRNFTIGIGAVNAGDKVILLKNLPTSNYVAHIYIADRTVDTGANYECTLNSSNADAGILSPTTVDAHNSKFVRIHVGWTSALGRYVTAEVTASAPGRTYFISIESQSADLSGVQVGNGAETAPGSQTSFKADENYPGAALSNFLKAASGDASAQVPNNEPLGADFSGKTLMLNPGTINRQTGYFIMTGKGGGGSSYNANTQRSTIRLCRGGTDDAHALNRADVKYFASQYTTTDKAGKATQAQMFQGTKEGFFSTNISPDMTGANSFYKGPKNNVPAWFSIEIDARFKDVKILIETRYLGSNDEPYYCWTYFLVDAAKAPDRYYFSYFNDNVSTWEVYNQ